MNSTVEFHVIANNINAHLGSSLINEPQIAYQKQKQFLSNIQINSRVLSFSMQPREVGSAQKVEGVTPPDTYVNIATQSKIKEEHCTVQLFFRFIITTMTSA